MSDVSMAGKDFRGQSLRNADLTDKILFGTDLREADLYGAKISLLCQTFDGVKLSDLQVAYLLLMIAQADIDPVYQRGLHDLTLSVIGKTKHGVLLRMLRVV
jgi:uncharacterized protein YjbI with pentapeptide repeats